MGMGLIDRYSIDGVGLIDIKYRWDGFIGFI
jgi:hypothetical protein